MKFGTIPCNAPRMPDDIPLPQQKALLLAGCSKHLRCSTKLSPEHFNTQYKRNKQTLVLFNTLEFHQFQVVNSI